MAGRPELLKALDSLKLVMKGDQCSLESAFESCRAAPVDVHYAHVLYREIGEIAISHRQWKIAEEFAIKTLTQLPSSGAALKLLGVALHGQKKLADAAVCHRYGLPKSLRKRYFSDLTARSVHSHDTDSVECLSAHPAQTMPLAQPISLNGETIWELSDDILSSCPAHTYRLRDARLWFDGFNTIVWDCNGKIVNDISRGFPEVVQSALGTRPARRLTGRTGVLGNRNSSNYYHWMNDILPRVHVVMKSGVDLDSINQFVINPLQTDFQHETLKQLGIEESQLRVVESGHYFHCDELIVPVYGSNTLGKGQAPWNPAFLKSTFLQNKTTRPTARLYISRKLANGRSVENEEELASFLSKKGFKRVLLEGLGVSEQAALLNSASVVLGAHGAGLTNTVFCEPKTTVVELFDHHIAPCFWINSEMTGMTHAVHYCGKNQGGDFTPGDERYYDTAARRRVTNFHVDLDQLEKLLHKLDIT